MKIYDALPAGYRWCSPTEAEIWDQLPDVIQVRCGGTDDEPWTDLARPDESKAYLYIGGAGPGRPAGFR